jgi:uncharacterized protein YbaR (Trm112 family)
MSGYVNTLVYFYLALVCVLSKRKEYTGGKNSLLTVYPREFYPIYDEIPDYSNST